MAESTMLASTREPSPVRSRCVSALTMPNAPISAATGDVRRCERLTGHEPETVPVARCFGFEHVGTEVGEQERAERTRDHPGEVEHAYVCQRARRIGRSHSAMA